MDLMIPISQLSVEQLQNVARYQADNQLTDRLVCPNKCTEEYKIPGLCSMMPLTRQVVLRFNQSQQLWCSSARSRVKVAFCASCLRAYHSSLSFSACAFRTA